MIRDFVVIRLRPGKDDGLRDWLNALPPGSRSEVARRLLVLGLETIRLGMAIRVAQTTVLQVPENGTSAVDTDLTRAYNGITL
jgi:hypothetical protein